MAKKEENKPQVVAPRTQEDLERRLADDHEPDSAVNTGTVLVNPNPFGDEAYAGTDPIYQNHANDTEKPYRASKGAEKKAEDLVREAHTLDEDDDDVVKDTGMGGKARRTVIQSPVQSMNAADYESAPEPEESTDEEEPDADSSGDPTVPPPAPQNPSGSNS